MTAKNKTTLFGALQFFAGLALMGLAFGNYVFLFLFVALLVTGMIVYAYIFKEITTETQVPPTDSKNNLEYDIDNVEIEDYKELSFYKSGSVVSNHGEKFNVKIGRKGVLINCFLNPKQKDELRNNKPLSADSIWNIPKENSEWSLTWSAFVDFFGDYKHEILMKASPEYRENYNARVQLEQELNEENDYEENYNLLR